MYGKRAKKKMSWAHEQNKMIHELNGSVFSHDPINKTMDPMDPIDVKNDHYIMELKKRECGPERYDGSLIEKIKYDYLVKNCGDKIPGYVCKFNNGSYYAWNLKKLPEPEWYDKMLPETSHFDRVGWINKKVGNLYLKDAKKLL